MASAYRDGLPIGLGGGLTSDRPARLRELISSRGSYILPGVADALTARLVEEAGFQACYVTGAGIANMSLGLADVGLVTMSEMVDQVWKIAPAVEIPVIVDGDTGYGGPISVMRTVREYERAGAAGIQLEDQVIPKRCGHFSGKAIVPIEEMLAKIEAATLARQNPSFVIIARTDARAVEGFEAAIGRAHRFVEAGADVIFIEAPESAEELERIPQALPGIPLIINIVEGGLTPIRPADELERLGYKLILHANLVQRAMLKAAQETLAHLYEHRESNSLSERIISWQERQRLVQLAQIDDLEDRLRLRWQETGSQR